MSLCATKTEISFAISSAEDFTILEDNKPQKVVSFDLENTEAVAIHGNPEATLLATGKIAQSRRRTGRLRSR